MGTRADFYVRKEKEMTWLGSIAWDGYEVDDFVLNSTTEESYVTNVMLFLEKRDDATLPKDGWPWPWNDSRTTDYSYIFEGNKVMSSYFGYKLFDPLLPLEDEEEDSNEQEQKMENFFPDMRHIKNVQWGKKSGVIII